MNTTATETQAQQFTWMVMDIGHGTHLDLSIDTIGRDLDAAVRQINADSDIVAIQGIAPTPVAFVPNDDTMRVAFADGSTLIFTFYDGDSTGVQVYNGTAIVAAY